MIYREGQLARIEGTEQLVFLHDVTVEHLYLPRNLQMLWDLSTPQPCCGWWPVDQPTPSELRFAADLPSYRCEPWGTSTTGRYRFLHHQMLPRVHRLTPDSAGWLWYDTATSTFVAELQASPLTPHFRLRGRRPGANELVRVALVYGRRDPYFVVDYALEDTIPQYAPDHAMEFATMEDALADLKLDPNCPSQPVASLILAVDKYISAFAVPGIRLFQSEFYTPFNEITDAAPTYTVQPGLPLDNPSTIDYTTNASVSSAEGVQ